MQHTIGWLFGIAILLVATAARPCTTILIGRGLTADGSVIHAHNEDMGLDAVGRFWAVPAASYPLGETLTVPYVQLPQVRNGHAYWASGNASGAGGLGISEAERPYDSVLVGMNQWGVTLSCNWAHSKQESPQRRGIRRYAIRQLVLERARSARGKLSFKRAFGLPARMNEAYDIDRERRVHALLDARKGRITPGDLFPVLRDRYEGTEKYLRPQVTSVWREDLAKRPGVARTIATNLAQSTSVAHLRADRPAEIGAVMWYGMATPSYAGYFPVYAGGGPGLPAEFPRKSGRRSTESAWWLFRSLQQAADPRYDFAYPLIERFWTAHHANVVVEQAAQEAQAQALHEQGKRQAAVDLLSRFSNKTAESVLYHARRLLSLVAKSE